MVMALAENFWKADAVWTAELKRSFGKDAGYARYNIEGRGVEGTALRSAYEGFCAARDAWRAAS